MIVLLFLLVKKILRWLFEGVEFLLILLISFLLFKSNILLIARRFISNTYRKIINS